MKIIHCSDLHLDAPLRTHHDEQTARQRGAEMLHTFHRLVDFARTHNVLAILLCGDLFDAKTTSNSTRHFVENEILDNPGIHFFYLRGNHDADSLLFSGGSVPANLHLFNHSWHSSNITMKGNSGKSFSVSITGAELPEIDHFQDPPGTANASGRASNSGRVNDMNRTETLLSSLRLDPARINIVLLHGQLTEGNVIHRAESIPLSLLRNRSIDYLALGHLHSYRKGRLDARGQYVYSGSLEGHGFDECGEHGFVLIEIDEHSRQLSSTFHPFAARKYYDIHADISLCPDTTHTMNAVRNALEKSNATSTDLVRVTLTGQTDVTSEHSPYLISKEFADHFFYFTLIDESKVSICYDDYLCDASLKGEFVRTIYAAPEVKDCDKAELIRCGLRALAGEELFDL